tara:strand:+ start:126 stop:275 length:150 start_codon:yes stop_codon:yes gene_type:complete
MVMPKVILKTNEGVQKFSQRKDFLFFILFLVHEQLRAVSRRTMAVLCAV